MFISPEERLILYSEEESDFATIPHSVSYAEAPRRYASDPVPNIKNAYYTKGIKKAVSYSQIPLTVVLDLDNTMVFTSNKPFKLSDFVIMVPIESGYQKLYVVKRPYLDQFLNKLSKVANLYLFSAGEKVYVDQVVQNIDPFGNLFKKIYYRDSCKKDSNGFYIKDLSVLGTPLERTILVDDSVASFGQFTSNGIKISPYHGEVSDNELSKILEIIQGLTALTDIRDSLCPGHSDKVV